MGKLNSSYHLGPNAHLTSLTNGNTLTTTVGHRLVLNKKLGNMLSSEQVAQSRLISGTGCKEQALMHRPGGRKHTTQAGGIELSGFIYSSSSGFPPESRLIGISFIQAKRAAELAHGFSRKKKYPTMKECVAGGCSNLML